MEWDESLKYRFRGDYIENEGQKVMLFRLDEPEMVKTENIVLPPTEAEADGQEKTEENSKADNLHFASRMGKHIR